MQKYFSAILVLAIASVPLSEACRCRMLEEPAYCRTDFVAIVKITSESRENGLHFNYDLIEDLSYGRNAGIMKDHKFISTAGNTGACGIVLGVGQTYLVAGPLGAEPHAPSMRICDSYHEEWEYTGEKSVGHAADIRKQCDTFHRNATTIIKPDVIVH